ncbi:MAG TPA: GNAT family N-acetyltransferase [Acidimicrobiales bacterium]|nr:GNAT family N-acetyltransferase [Acidimicrobiales bacterium]
MGVSLWLPPGAFPPTASTQLAQLPGTLAAFWRYPSSMVNGNRIMRAAFRAHPKEPHWYLQLLAVEPSAQRSGVGAALMAPTIARIDDEHLPAYLETQNEENVAYYARYRFSLAHRLEPVEGAPPLLALRREAT